MSTLHNTYFLITRAAHQTPELITAIESKGGRCLSFPCINIIALHDTQTVQQALAHIADYDICIFTSSNAVINTLKQQPRCAIAIGPGTAAALHAAGVDCQMPAHYSSEGLLEMDILQNISNKKIAIFTGENPRPLLADALQKRDADVSVIHCYRRQCPQYTNTEIKNIRKQPIDTIIVSSDETLQNLYQIFSDHHDWLLSRSLLVTSAKMLASAKQLRFTHISCSDNSSVEAIIQVLHLCRTQ